jgi:Ca2+/Na+ antiporter
VYEIFAHVFSAYPALERLGTLLFRWATAVLMVVAVALVAYTTGSELNRISVAVGVIDRAVSIVQCGLLVFLLLLARFLKFSWRTYAFGIALGLGFFASVQLVSTAIQSYVGVMTHLQFFDLVSMATYHCCVLFWIVALYLPEKKTARVTSVPSQGLEHWNEALQQLLQQ